MYCQMDIVNQLMEELKKNTNNASWKKTYSFRIRKFFEEYLSQEMHKDRRLMAITEKEVDDFIQSLPYKHNEKVNYYSALKKFFDYTAKKGLTYPFFIKVKKIAQEDIERKYISDSDLERIIQFIKGNSKIERRIKIALFLYTGLSRRIISELRYEQIIDDFNYFYFNNGDIKIPIKNQLSKLLYDYSKDFKIKDSDRLFNIEDSTLTTEVKYICKDVCGYSYSPKELSNTFIINMLGSDKWKNIYVVSKLTMKSIPTIEKHFSDLPSWLIDEQKKLLEEWK